MGAPAIAITLAAEERVELAGLANRRRTAQGLARRASPTSPRNNSAVASIAPRPPSKLPSGPTYIDSVNANPKPFVWTKSADDILASIKRFGLKTANIQTQITQTSESVH